MGNIVNCCKSRGELARQKEKRNSQEDEVNRLAMTFNSGAILY